MSPLGYGVLYIILFTIVMGAVAFLAARNIDKRTHEKQMIDAQRSAEREAKLALEADASMVEAFIQTRGFLGELVQNPSLPEEVRHRAAVLHRHYPGRNQSET